LLCWVPFAMWGMGGICYLVPRGALEVEGTKRSLSQCVHLSDESTEALQVHEVWARILSSLLSPFGPKHLLCQAEQAFAPSREARQLLAEPSELVPPLGLSLCCCLLPIASGRIPTRAPQTPNFPTLLVGQGRRPQYPHWTHLHLTPGLK
jgi:hypothetical protein